MKIGLLIIGNEILEGKVNDANGRALSLFLRENNYELNMSMVVRDTEEDIHRGLTVLFNHCDIIISSGGLGPTKDDVTKETFASFMDRKIAFSEEAFLVASKNYQRFNREFAGKDHGYCYLPEGFVALDNSTGFAPCFFTEHQGKIILCAPGVPREFKSLLDDHFIRLTKNKFPTKDFITTVMIRTKGIPEEKIFNELDTTLWDKLSALGSVSSLPTTLGVDISVKIVAPSAAKLDAMKSQALEIFKNSPVVKMTWQVGNKSLEEFIVNRANELNLTYGFAESATGGLCSHRVTSVSGSSKTFMGSVVSYDNSVKKSVLKVSNSTLERSGPVSEQTALEMATGLRVSLNLEIAISITGLAGPTGGSPELPVGTVWIGVSTARRTFAQNFKLPGDREQLKLRFSQVALYALLDEMAVFAQN